MLPHAKAEAGEVAAVMATNAAAARQLQAEHHPARLQAAHRPMERVAADAVVPVEAISQSSGSLMRTNLFSR
jgi:hypothetical protein